MVNTNYKTINYLINLGDIFFQNKMVDLWGKRFNAETFSLQTPPPPPSLTKFGKIRV